MVGEFCQAFAAFGFRVVLRLALPLDLGVGRFQAPWSGWNVAVACFLSDFFLVQVLMFDCMRAVFGVVSLPLVGLDLSPSPADGLRW